MIATTTLLAVTALGMQQGDSVPPRDTVVLLEEYVVSATRATQARRIDEAEALSLVRPSLSDRGAGTIAAHLLREAPGVRVQQTSAGQGSVILRGMLGNQVLMLVNGVPMNNATYRDGPGQYLATIDPETIERIEILRGPASVVYGSDAQGGVVNIITTSHPEVAAPLSARVAASASSGDHSVRARASARASGDDWTLALGGTRLVAGDLRAGEGLGPQDPTGFDANGLDAELRYRPAPDHTMGLTLQHFAMHGVPRYDRYVTFRAPAVGRDHEHTFDPQARQLAYARWQHTPHRPILSTLEATVSLATQREHRNRIKLTDADIRTRWRDDVYTPGVSVVGSSLLLLDRYAVALSWGGDFYHDVMDSDGVEENLATGVETDLTRASADGPISVGNFPDGATADRLGVFLSAETDIGPVRLSAGARYSRFRNVADVGADFGGPVENTSADLTGQIGIVLAPARAWRVALRLAEGFRAPNLYDLTRVGPVPGGVALPYPEAVPERSLSGEASVRFSTARSRFDVTVYATRVRDFIDRVPGTFQGDTLFLGERVFQGRNVGTARLRGIEAEAAQVLGPFTARANVLYTYGVQEHASGIEAPMSKIPPLGGTASLRWTAPDRQIWFEYVMLWATTQDRLGTRDETDPRIPPGGTPGYAAYAVRGGLELTRDLTVTGGVENITDELYRPHASGVDAAGRHAWVGMVWMGGL
jgi:outer membrane receptor protein involved in Fe transport